MPDRAWALRALRGAADALDDCDLWPLSDRLRALPDDCDLRAAARVAWCGLQAAAHAAANESMTASPSPHPARAARVCSLAMDAAHAAAAGDARRAQQYAEMAQQETQQ